MPLLNSNQNVTSFGKYGVFIADTYAGTYKLCKRIIIQNFRTQMRGLGSCGIIILPKDQVNETFDVEIKTGQFAKILDTSLFFEEDYTSVGDELFFGTITSVTSDVFAGKNDDKGFGTIDEIGQFYSKKPIIWSSKPQVFNPIVSGICYGNKKKQGESNIFETKVADMAKAKLNGINAGKFESDSAGSSTAGNTKVWSLEDYLRYMANIHGVDIKFPWEFDQKIATKQQITLNPAQEKLYKYFKDSIDIKSYDHYDGKSFQELLQDNINEPFDWFYTAQSTSGPTIQIVNKSPIVALDWCPSAVLVKQTLDPKITTNFNITKQDEVYSKLIYRGNNILIAGTLGSWNCNSSASILPDWTDAEESTYVDANNEKEIPLAASFRAKDKKVYQQFKYKHLDQDCPIQIPKKIVKTGNQYKYTQAPLYPKGTGQEAYEMTPFFPRIDFVEYQNNSTYVLPTPKVFTELGVHKTPSLLELQWSDKLPWIVDKQVEMRSPFIVSTSFLADSAGDSWYYTYDLTKSGGGYDTLQFKHSVDGYKIEISLPETLAYVSDDLFNCGGSVVGNPADKWTDEKVSDRNPKTSNYNFFTNYMLFGATIAGFSDQRLEWTVDNPDTTINTTKTKIIEDKSLECWLVHAGTIKEIINAPSGVQTETGRSYKNGYDRFDNDTFIKNDFKKVYNLARQTANWLFVQKASAKVEVSLMNYTSGVWNLGEVIGQIIDNQQTRTINTCVYSIEYDLVSNRLNISTSIPEMPTFKKLSSTPMSKSTISPTTDSKDSTIQIREKVITKEDYPTHGYVSGGAAAGSTVITPSHLYTIIGGQTLPYLGGVGIKHVTTKIESISQTPIISAGQPSTLTDGIGWAVSMDDLSYALIVNDKDSLTTYDLICQPIYAGVNCIISGGDGKPYPALRAVAPM